MTDTPTAPVPTAPAPDPRTEFRTFLFADIRGYTRFTQEHGDEAAAALVRKFAAIADGITRPHAGRLVELRGDEALLVFSSARQALRAAVELQSTFARESQNDPSLPLRVGVGIDAGEAVQVDDGYRGEALNLAARLCNLAGPGEILATEGVVYLGRRVQNVAYAERGVMPLKGFADPVRVIRVIDAAALTDGDDAVSPAISVLSQAPIGGFLGALPSGVLVGRDQEWEGIMTSMEAVMQGTGRLVLLSGEPGIGKTRIAQEVSLKARHWGFLIATGRCYEPEQAVPFYPFIEALQTVFNASAAYLRAEMPRRWPYLSRLLPDLVPLPTTDNDDRRGPESGMPVLGTPAPLEQEDQQRLFRAVTGFLVAVAETLPVAILIDDLHWADDTSLKLLQHLARYTRGHRILLLGTYRDVEVTRQHPLEAMLVDLAREQLVDEVEVRALDEEGTAALMAEIMGGGEDLGDLVSLIHRRTDGNAFFIQEMMRALVESGSVYRKDGRWEGRGIRDMEVPKSVRSVIGQRLSGLSSDAQEILREASIIGQEFNFDDVLTLANLADLPARRPDPDAPRWSEDEVEVGLIEASQAGLVRETNPDRYAFNHALIHQTLYAELSTRRRKRLHLAAGRALEHLPEPARRRRAGELAWHFLEGDDAEAALPYALLAGDRAETVFANGDAARHYRNALELAREVEDHDLEAEALEKLARVLTIIGHYDQALDLMEEAVELHRQSGDREREACAVAQMGHIHFQRGTWAEGVARLRPMVEALEGTEPTYGQAALWAALARLYVNTGQYRDQQQAAERAIELAHGIPDRERARPIVLSAELTRSDALWDLGREEESLHAVERLIPQAEEAGDLDNLTRALANAALYYGRRGDLERDRVYHERMLALARRRGDLGYIVMGSMALSQNAYLAGDWNKARTYLEEAAHIIENLGARRLGTWPVMARAWLTLREGGLDESTRLGREVVDRAESSGEAEYGLLANRLLAEIDLMQAIGGDAPQRAGRAFARLAGLLDLPGAQADSGFLRALAWAYLETGNALAAETAAARAVGVAREWRDRPELVEALTIHGMIAARAGRWDDAEQLLSEALTLARAMPFPYAEARALFEWGIMQALRGEIEPARDRLEEALWIFQRLDARHDIERTRRVLERIDEDD